MTEPARTTERSTFAKLVLFLVAASALGFVMSLIGNVAGWKGFENGGESTLAGSTFWFLYFFGGLAALVAGVIALVRGRRGGAASEQQAGQLALAFVVLSVLVVVVSQALGD